MKAVLWMLLLIASVAHCDGLLPSTIANWASDRSRCCPPGRRDWCLYARSPRSGARRLAIPKKQPIAPINERIVAETVRLIEPSREDNGEEVMSGVYSLEEARRRAQELGLDLVLISAEANPPVCKIIDYGKYSYAMEKKKKTAQKKQSKDELKELKLSPKIDQHDFEVKVRAAQKFVTGGDRVRLVVDFRGRQMAHTEIGRNLLERFVQAMNASAVVDGVPKLEGRSMAVLLMPAKKRKKTAAAD